MSASAVLYHVNGYAHGWMLHGLVGEATHVGSSNWIICPRGLVDLPCSQGTWPQSGEQEAPVKNVQVEEFEWKCNLMSRGACVKPINCLSLHVQSPTGSSAILRSGPSRMISKHRTSYAVLYVLRWPVIQPVCRLHGELIHAVLRNSFYASHSNYLHESRTYQRARNQVLNGHCLISLQLSLASVASP